MSGANDVLDQIEGAAARIIQSVKLASPGVTDETLLKALAVAMGMVMNDIAYPQTPLPEFGKAMGVLVAFGVMRRSAARTREEKASCKGEA